MRNCWRNCLSGLLGLGIVSLSLPAGGQSIPALLNYQGQISNPTGVPLTTGDYEMAFSIYDTPDGSTAVWGPQRFNGNTGLGLGMKIPVVQGYFNVALGPVDTSGRSLTSAFGSAPRYVEMTLGTNPPIRPRQQLLTVPFAFRSAASADSSKLAGYDWSSILTSGNNPAAGTLNGKKIQPGSVERDQIAPGAIDATRLAPARVFLGTAVDVLRIGPALPDNPTPFVLMQYNALALVDTNLDLTLNSTGRPMWIGLLGQNERSIAEITTDASRVPNIFLTTSAPGATVFPETEFHIVDLGIEGRVVASTRYLSPQPSMIDYGRCSSIVTLSPGTHKLRLFYRIFRAATDLQQGSDNIGIRQIRLGAFEL